MFCICVVSLVILNLQISYGNNNCLRLSSGKDFCLTRYDFQLNFEESKVFCHDKGGFLLEIHTDEMQKLVQNIARNTSLKFNAAWLNLLRTNVNVWVWGGAKSGQKF